MEYLDYRAHAAREVYEEFIIDNIIKEIDSILYAGVLSGGFAFVLQIYAQRSIAPAPAAIIFSLEGVFATIAAWFLLNQILEAAPHAARAKRACVRRHGGCRCRRGSVDDTAHGLWSLRRHNCSRGA